MIKSKMNVLVLGFYFRNNIGDDMYIPAFKKILPSNCNLSFISMDDVQAIPANTDMIIFGGGDIINDYFMKKAQRLLKDYSGPVYALSIGIPYPSCSHYLQLFDHVFTRSSIDTQIAIAEIGSKNVTQMYDAVFSMVPRFDPSFIRNRRTRIGVALAQPIFFNNPNKTRLVQAFLTSLVNFVNHIESQGRKPEVNLIACNRNSASRNECDFYINEIIQKQFAVLKPKVPIRLVHDMNENTFIEFITFNIDFMICMRYHSIIFSILTQTPFIAIYPSSKVDNLIEDFCGDEHYKLPVDSTSRPTNIEIDVLTNKIITQYDKNTYVSPPSIDVSSIHDVINRKKLKYIMYKPTLRSFEDVLASCRRAFVKYLQIDANQYHKLLYQRGKFPLPSNIKPLTFARFVCFLICGQTHHVCVWGLSQNLTHDDFCLIESIKYVWRECEKNVTDAQSHGEQYYESITVPRNILVNTDFIMQNDLSDFHRSGWAYVIRGLTNFDGPHLMRKGCALIDTYVDRTFHWAHDIFKSAGIIPYTQPWYGFIHHTFNTTHSEYNCVNLLKNPSFVTSLSTCKGLIALSKDLANKLRASLPVDVPVHVLYHPMEFVQNNFTMEKFYGNPKKCVIQIGAWMRNPYAIYQLNLPKELTKVALKGKEMDQYFAPPQFLHVLQDTLFNKQWFEDKESHGSDSISYMCRPSATDTNKFCQGVYEMVDSQLSSVEILEKLNNIEYDELLSKNIVFLNLVDCSAVNTVIECIVRNTPIIVNRLPALEEILGSSYPGFYNTLKEAERLLESPLIINKIYYYLFILDKRRFTLEYFLEQFQNVIMSGKCEHPMNVDFFDPRKLIKFKYQRFMKFLPSSMQI